MKLSYCYYLAEFIICTIIIPKYILMLFQQIQSFLLLKLTYNLITTTKSITFNKFICKWIYINQIMTNNIIFFLF